MKLAVVPSCGSFYRDVSTRRISQPNEDPGNHDVYCRELLEKMQMKSHFATGVTGINLFEKGREDRNLPPKTCDEKFLSLLRALLYGSPQIRENARVKRVRDDRRKELIASS